MNAKIGCVGTITVARLSVTRTRNTSDRFFVPLQVKVRQPQLGFAFALLLL
jgi:hypothetical protein